MERSAGFVRIEKPNKLSGQASGICELGRLHGVDQRAFALLFWSNKQI
jgi:hypothetical protein